MSTLLLLDRQPYVYIISSVSTGKRYAGVKFAKGCKPEDLLVKYFTSSKVVKQLISDGMQFEIEKIVTFDSKEDAIEFEELLLFTTNAHLSADWYNLSAGKAINPEAVRKTCLEKYGVDNWMHSEEAKDSNLGFKEGNTFGCFKRSEETKQRMSIAFKGRVYSPEARRNMSNSKKGRKVSVETRLKMSENTTRGKHPRAIRVSTPTGIFDCINDAADAFGVSSACIRKWIKSKPDLFFKLSHKEH